MIRLFLAFVIGLTAFAPAQDKRNDRPFSVPFDAWIANNDTGTIHSRLKVSSAHLSHHQRLRITIVDVVDGKELVKREARGEVTFYAQITDAVGHQHRSHTAIPVRDVDKETRRADIEFVQDVLITPGEYRLDVAIVHSASGDHGLAQKRFTIHDLSNDPLPEAGRDLPPVEFIEENDPPDRWYLPSAKGRLNLPLSTTRPVRVELLVNATQSQVAAGSGRLQDRTLGALLPAVRVLSNIDVRNGVLNISALDLERRKQSFTQENVHELDWPRLRDAITGSDPNVIDVASLANRGQSLAFFQSRLLRKMESSAPGDPLLVLIVLTPPMMFTRDVQLRPIEAVESANTLIFYVRYHPESMFGSRGERGSPSGFDPENRRPGREPVFIPTTPRPGSNDDYLENTLKPLKPRLFDVYTPQDFRHALAAILAAVAQAAR